MVSCFFCKHHCPKKRALKAFVAGGASVEPLENVCNAGGKGLDTVAKSC